MLKVYQSDDDCCVVHAGDTLGLVNAHAVASQFLVADAGARFSDSDDDKIVIGDQLKFDALIFPYRFLLAAVYDTGRSTRLSQHTRVYQYQ